MVGTEIIPSTTPELQVRSGTIIQPFSSNELRAPQCRQYCGKNHIEERGDTCEEGIGYVL